MLLCGNLILREHSARTSRLLTLRLEVVSFAASAARTDQLANPVILAWFGCPSVRGVLDKMQAPWESC